MRLFLSLLISFVAVAPHFAQTAKPISVEQFFNQPFGFEESIPKLTLFSGIAFKVKKEPVGNIHNPTVTDTLYHLKKGKNRISLYKAEDKSFMYQAKLCSKKARMANNIRPGMKRDVFYASFTDLKPVDGKVHTFHNSERTATATVTFKRNKVKAIAVEYNVD